MDIESMDIPPPQSKAWVTRAQKSVERGAPLCPEFGPCDTLLLQAQPPVGKGELPGWVGQEPGPPGSAFLLECGLAGIYQDLLAQPLCSLPSPQFFFRWEGLS